MGTDDIYLDAQKADEVKTALSGIADQMAGLYQEFGGRTGVGDVGVDPAAVLGTRDPTDDPAPADAGTDVVNGWLAFCTQWGQFIDEAVGVTTAMSYAMGQTVMAYQGTDDRVANAFRDAHGDLGRFAGETVLTAPPGAPAAPTAAAPNRDSTSGAETGKWAWLTTKVPPPPPPGAPPPGAGTSAPSGAGTTPPPPAGTAP